jgi:TIGR03118 family protein
MKINKTNKTASAKSTFLRPSLFAIAVTMALAAFPSAAKNPNATQHYVQVNLVSDLPGVAQIQDTNLVNAWGVSFSASSPFWISDNGTGKSTLYAVTNGVVTRVPLVVNIPGEGNPTGQLFNNTTAFHTNVFIFVSEDGTISGWRGALGTNAEVLATVSNAVYKGVALATTSNGPVLLAANFSQGTVDVFNSNVVRIAQFVDANAPAGYAPFNVQNIGGLIFVTFAKQDAAKEDDVPGPGHGLIDVLNPNTGSFHRFATGTDAGGDLSEIDSPWGLALAPDSFGKHGGELLVGNFGSGTIMTFNAEGDFQGLLKAHIGGPVVIDGLWALTFGNTGSAGGDTDTIFFTAGPDDEAHGLFGALVPFTNNGRRGH